MPITPDALGLGCAYLVGKVEMRGSLRILEAAYDAGLRYFDTAPLYGIGTSEDVVGEFSRGRRDKLDIATKVGLPRPQFGPVAQVARRLTGPLRAIVRRRRSRPVVQAGSSQIQRVRLDAAFLQSSLEDSLRRLQTDYVDALILHEAALPDIAEETLAALARFKGKGLFRRLGVGASVCNLQEINKAHPHLFDFYQHSWSVVDRSEGAFPDKDVVLHRSILYALPALRQDFISGRRDLRRFIAATDKDLESDEELAKVLIGASTAVNGGHRTLFASRDANRVKDYTLDLLTGDYVEAGRAFVAQMDEQSLGLDLAERNRP